MHRRRLLLLAALVLGTQPLGAAAPKAAPLRFTTQLYALTMLSPANGSYCPLPPDWVGSDHGTIVFLERPRVCGGAGYPSSGRGFRPANAPRIEVYYAYWMEEDEPPPPPCHRVGDVRLFSRLHPICQAHDDGMITQTVQGRYRADIESQVILTLVTTPDRLGRDGAAFRRMVESIRTCKATWHDAGHKSKGFTIGTGQPCPAGTFY